MDAYARKQRLETCLLYRFHSSKTQAYPSIPRQGSLSIHLPALNHVGTPLCLVYYLILIALITVSWFLPNTF